MKKINYILLQIVISLILISFGMLVEIKGTASIWGIASILITVPGIVIFLSMFIGLIKFKKFWQFPLLIFFLTALLDGAVYLYFKMTRISVNFCLLYFFIAVVTTAICELFYLVYHVVNKKLR